MLSTMSDYPLTIGSILEYGIKVHGTSRVQTWTGEGPRAATFCEVGARAKQLARALEKLGIRPGDRVGTLCWNTQEHLEAYYAISSMGAVVHTLNVRLFPDQLAYIINHGADRIILVDAPLVPLLPIAGVILCFAQMVFLPPPTWIRLAIWLVIGLAIYFFYGYRKSRLNG